MGRVLGPYEIAWRKSAGHPVDDDEELERLTKPEPVPAEPPTPPPAVTVPTPPAKPLGKK